MKSRILDELNKLAVGELSKYLDDLIKSTGKTEEAIRKEAREILEFYSARFFKVFSKYD